MRETVSQTAPDEWQLEWRVATMQRGALSSLLRVL